MDAAKLEKNLVSGIKKFFSKRKKPKAVLGLSGGIDSAVVACLLAKALGKGNVAAILMPNSRLTLQANVEDAKSLAQSLGIKHFVVAIDEFLSPFHSLPWAQTKIAKANLNARVRAVILYNYANSNGALVSGTGNKSEFYMGYFTKYGDAAADFFPIGALLKKEVRSLAMQMNLPKEFLEKAPSAELWEGQEDEKEMGVTYEVLDELLPKVLKKLKIPKGKEKIAQKISAAIKATGHKREKPEIIKL